MKCSNFCTVSLSKDKTNDMILLEIQFHMVYHGIISIRITYDFVTVKIS